MKPEPPDAVQAQPGSIETVTLPLPPAEATETAVGVIEDEQDGAGVTG